MSLVTKVALCALLLLQFGYWWYQQGILRQVEGFTVHNQHVGLIVQGDRQAVVGWRPVLCTGWLAIVRLRLTHRHVTLAVWPGVMSQADWCLFVTWLRSVEATD